MRNILGVRLTNISFISRLPGFERRFDEPSPSQEVRGFGPWFEGTFEALSLTFNMRFRPRYQLTASYTYARAADNLRCPDLSMGLSVCVPSDLAPERTFVAYGLVELPRSLKSAGFFARRAAFGSAGRRACP